MTGCIIYLVIVASKGASREEMTLIPNQSITSTEFLEEENSEWFANKTKLYDANAHQWPS